MGRNCAVHKHRNDVPIELHHIWPIGMGGPDAPGNIVSVCANGHHAVHDYMRLLARGSATFLQRRRYGKKVRRLAIDGLTRAANAPKRR